MGGKGSGPQRKSKGRADSQRSLTNMLPKAIAAIELTVEGENADRLRYEAAVEIKNSVLGRPKQEIDQRLKGEILITPDMRALAAREILEIREEEAKLLKEGDDA